MEVEPMSKFGVLDLGFIIGFIVGSCRFRPKFLLLCINSEFYRCNKISSLQWLYELVSLWSKFLKLRLDQDSWPRTGNRFCLSLGIFAIFFWRGFSRNSDKAIRLIFQGHTINGNQIWPGMSQTEFVQQILISKDKTWVLINELI